MQINNRIKQEIIDQLLIYEPEFIGLFGSYMRNEATKNSDLDILVSFNKRITLIDLSRMKNKLHEKLNLKIDLVTQQSLDSKIMPYIEKDLQIIYNAQK